MKEKVSKLLKGNCTFDLQKVRKNNTFCSKGEVYEKINDYYVSLCTGFKAQ